MCSNTDLPNIIFSVLDEDASPGVETMLVFSDHVRSFVNPVWTSSGRPVAKRGSLTVNDWNTASLMEKQSDSRQQQVQGLMRSFPPAVVMDHHPCENFSLSPPRIDRKRTGPRRKCTFLTVPIQCHFSSESKLMYLSLYSLSSLLFVGGASTGTETS